MDNDEYTDRRSEAVQAVLTLYANVVRKPTPDEVRDMLSVFYEFLATNDMTVTDKADNVTTLKRGV